MPLCINYQKIATEAGRKNVSLAQSYGIHGPFVTLNSLRPSTNDFITKLMFCASDAPAKFQNHRARWKQISRGSILCRLCSRFSQLCKQEAIFQIYSRSVGEVFELLGCWCFLAFLKTERNRLKREILDGNFYIVHCN